jgi:putative tricarboxylic transport membrane protein
VLFPSILFFCCIGTYSVNNNLDDIFITAVFGLLGYIFMRLEMDAAPLMLGFILGPMLEENFRRAMLLSRGSFGSFLTRPISGTLLGLIGIFVAWQVTSFFLQARKTTAPHQLAPAHPEPQLAEE